MAFKDHPYVFSESQNTKHLETTGYSQSQIVVHTPTSIFPPQDTRIHTSRREH